MAFFSALYNLSRALFNDDNQTDKLMETAFKAKKKGNYSKAIDLYTKAIEAGRNTWISWFYRGQCRELSGDKDGAIADYEQAIAIAPKYSGQAKEALELLKKKS